MLKITVCIEQEAVREKYLGYIRQLADEQHLEMEIDTFESGRQLLFEWSGQECHADIIFLGTREIDELQIAQRLREQDVDTSIVLLLENAEKALAAFDAQVLRCIALDEMDWQEQSRIIEVALQKAKVKSHQHIVLRTSEETCRVLIHDIQYFEMINHKVVVHYQRHGEQPQEFAFRGSIGKLVHILEDRGFVHPNRGYLVAKSYVKQLGAIRMILYNDVEISISKARRNAIKNEMML